MTESTQSNETNQDINITQDWLLEFLVDTANASGVSPFSVTINIGGLIISGKVISAKHYFERLAQDIADGLRKGGANQETIDFTIESFTKLGTLPKVQNDTDDAPRPNYFHLDDAKFFFPGNLPIPNNQSILWRGMIKNIDGIIFGSLSAEVK